MSQGNSNQILEYLSEGIIRIDRSGLISSCNSAASVILGLGKKSDELIGLPFLTVLPDHCCRGSHRTLGQKTIAFNDLKDGCDVLLEFRNSPSSMQYVLLKSVPILIDNGNSAGNQAEQDDLRSDSIITLRDVTHFEEAMLEFLLESDLKAGMEIVSHIGHEINNPLTAAMGGIEIARDMNLEQSSNCDSIDKILASALKDVRKYREK